MSIVVVFGGISGEREISLESGKAVYNSLITAGRPSLLLDINFHDSIIWTYDYWHKTVPAMTDDGYLEILFLAFHGGAGENGHIQAFLDSIKIPYTGAGKLASALAMDKHNSKMLFRKNNVSTPDWILITKESQIPQIKWFPCVVKPNAEGSSLGLTIVENKKQLLDALEKAFTLDHSVLIEEYILGRELTISILDNEAYPIVEIVPRNKYYDYESKYLSDSTQYIVPAEIDDVLTKQAQNIAMEAFRVLDCEIYGRVDLRMNLQNELFCLELNTLPGLTSHSLLPKAAEAKGINFFELILKIIRISKERYDSIL